MVGEHQPVGVVGVAGEAVALERLRRALTPVGRLFIDGEIRCGRFRCTWAKP